MMLGLASIPHTASQGRPVEWQSLFWLAGATKIGAILGSSNRIAGMKNRILIKLQAKNPHINHNHFFHDHKPLIMSLTLAPLFLISDIRLLLLAFKTRKISSRVSSMAL